MSNRKRRGRGEGGVYQRADGLWVATLSLGLDAAGKRKRRVAYGKTKAAAIAKLWELKDAPAAMPDARTATVGGYLVAWLDVVRGSLRATTHTRYTLLVTQQIIPHIGGVKLAGLTGLHVDQFHEAMRRAGESDWSVFHAAVVLKTALKAAVKKGMLLANPCDQATRPKAPKTTPKFWTAGEVKQFLAAAREDRFSAFFVLALMTGARTGELLGLHWPEVNFDDNAITIVRTLEDLRGRLTLREPKTERARRKIDLPAPAVEALLEHRKAMLAEGRDVRSGLVFPDTKGGPMRHSNLTRQHFKPLVKAAGVPMVRMHDMRHSHASLMLAMGVNPKVVQERLGHSRVETTLGIYSHVAPTLQRDAADKLGRLLG